MRTDEFIFNPTEMAGGDTSSSDGGGMNPPDIIIWDIPGDSDGYTKAHDDEHHDWADILTHSDPTAEQASAPIMEDLFIF